MRVYVRTYVSGHGIHGLDLNQTMYVFHVVSLCYGLYVRMYVRCMREPHNIFIIIFSQNIKNECFVQSE